MRRVHRGDGSRRFLSMLLSLALAVAFSAPLRAQAEVCAEAEEVALGVYSGSTLSASSDGSSSCGSSGNSPDVWFRHVAARDGLLVARTCGSDYDTVVSIHSGCPGVVPNELACNDDACDLQSTAVAIAKSGLSYWIRVSGYDGARGPFQLELQIRELPEGDGPDAVITDMRDMRQVGRAGAEIACAWESEICNIGSEPLDWFENPNPNHPFLVFNLYRLLDDRFEQIGQSWAKHAFSASQDDACGLGCLPAPGSSQLGIGCADVYGTSTNAHQLGFGPRSEINPWTGEFVYAGSHIQTQTGSHGPLDHRLRISEADLDPSLNAGAQYFVEMYVVSSQDADSTNSVGWEPVTRSGSVGGTWRFDVGSTPSTLGPAIDAWEGAVQTALPEDPVDDGRCVLAAKATSLGSGDWRYEYALYNHDLDRQVGSFRIPVSSSTSVRNVGFHAVRSYGEGYSNAAWQFSRDDTELAWTSENNPLRWGTVYNFRFDADRPPTDGLVRLGLVKPGTPAELSGLSVTPRSEPRFRRGDSNADGSVDVADAITTLGFLFLGALPPACANAADADDSGLLDVSDAVAVLSWSFLGGFEPPAPGPIECGPDPSPAPFPECSYPTALCGDS